MSDDSKKGCDSCEYRRIVSVAAKYCRSCQEHLCKDCIDFHRSFKLTRGHVLIDIEDTQSLQFCLGLESLRMCKKHSNKPIEFYCFAHEDPLCSFCLIKNEQHKECNTTIVDIESVGKSLIDSRFPSTANSEFKKTISLVTDSIQEMNRKKTESKAHIVNLKSNIEQIRTKLIKTFDNKTKKVIQNAVKVSEDTDGRYSKKIEKLEGLVKTAETNSLLLESVLKSGSPEDVFRCSIRMIELIDHFKIETDQEKDNINQEIVILKSDMLEKLEKNDEPLVHFQVKETKLKQPNINQSEISHKDMKKQFLSLCSLKDKQSNAEVKAEIIKCEDISSKANNAKFENETVNTVNNSSDGIETEKKVRTNITQKGTKSETEHINVELNHNCCFSVSPSDDKVSWFGGLACLQNDHLVISDYKHSRLFLLNKNYQVISTKKLEYEPGQVCLLSESSGKGQSVSVCLMKTSQILLIGVQQEFLKDSKYIQTKFHPKCVQPVDDKMLVSCQNGNGEWTLSLMTTHGVVCREIKLTRFFDGHRIAVQRVNRKENKLRIIQGCEVTNQLQCFEFDGTFVFCKDISKVTSVVTDDNGYIFVVRYTGEIQVLTPDGDVIWKMFRQPLNKAKFAAFSKTMDKLFITQYKTPKLNVLNVRRTIVL